MKFENSRIGKAPLFSENKILIFLTYQTILNINLQNIFLKKIGLFFGFI